MKKEAMLKTTIAIMADDARAILVQPELEGDDAGIGHYAREIVTRAVEAGYVPECMNCSGPVEGMALYCKECEEDYHD